MAAIVADWTRLMANHPSYETIHDKVSGIPDDWETCCIQMSYALNKSGLPIGWRPGIIGMQQNGDNFILKVDQLRGYLVDEFGDPENYQGAARIALISQIIDRRGVLAFGDRHIDLWTGTNIHRPSLYHLSALWEAKSTLRDGIYFWEVGTD